ncbi:MAG TPA: DUF2207 domain-containing protein [Thermodesulfovibrionales bacterium]|nr:DUF2207 domain-containing protein [Thermodesulfovibrionales bacterium]
MLRSAFRAALSLLCLCLCLCSGALAQDFTINEFESSMTVKKDSSFSVRETLSVEFHRPRHGIYRDIPFRYQDSFGSTITTPTDIISVTDGSDGKVKYRVSRTGNVIRVRIGDPKQYVSGMQKYEISYRVQNAILFLDDHDELYWNVTGNEWNAPIKKARCMVSLEGDKTGQYWASCYTGRKGSRESACRKIPGDNFIEFISQKDFMPGEGFTIAYGWNKGIVTPPSALMKFLWKLNLGQNWVFVLPLVSFIGMLMLWLRTGRDPRVRESVTVMYGPPASGDTPLSPAEVGAIVDEKLDPRDITASIVNLAVKGFLKIEEQKKEGLIFDSTDYYLRKVKEADSSLAPFERQLMNDIFGSSPGRMVSEMKNTFYRNIPSLKISLYGDLVQKKYFLSNPDDVRKMYLIIAGVLAAGTVILLSLLFGSSLGDARPFIAGILVGLPIFLFARYMPAKTRAGSAAYMHILGFQEFLNRAERDQLERMQDRNLFSTFFPYALALDVADNWAKAFEGIYQEQPDWYVSPGGMGAFNPAGFNRSFHSAISDMSTAIYSAPRGSGAGSGGSFGGGSSGGGFGGGGGGSW